MAKARSLQYGEESRSANLRARTSAPISPRARAQEELSARSRLQQKQKKYSAPPDGSRRSVLRRRVEVGDGRIRRPTPISDRRRWGSRRRCHRRPGADVRDVGLAESWPRLPWSSPRAVAGVGGPGPSGRWSDQPSVARLPLPGAAHRGKHWSSARLEAKGLRRPDLVAGTTTKSARRPPPRLMFTPAPPGSSPPKARCLTLPWRGMYTPGDRARVPRTRADLAHRICAGQGTLLPGAIPSGGFRRSVFRFRAARRSSVLYRRSSSMGGAIRASAGEDWMRRRSSRTRSGSAHAWPARSRGAVGHGLSALMEIQPRAPARGLSDGEPIGSSIKPGARGPAPILADSPPGGAPRTGLRARPYALRPDRGLHARARTGRTGLGGIAALYAALAEVAPHGRGAQPRVAVARRSSHRLRIVDRLTAEPLL